MLPKIPYWKQMKIQSEVTPGVCSTFIVKHKMAPLVQTDKIAVICRMFSHVPISCAPKGITRLDDIRSQYIIT